jgi:hypothetical protein
MALGNPITYYASKKGIRKRILSSKSFTEFFISDLKVNLSFKKWTLSSKLNKIKEDFAERGKERLSVVKRQSGVFSMVDFHKPNRKLTVNGKKKNTAQIFICFLLLFILYIDYSLISSYQLLY